MSGRAEGVLLIDKPSGWTSHDVVAYIRGILKIKKVGHAGTLDPFATGVLVVLVGRSATKRSAFFVNKDKEYIASLNFGVATTTGDPEGEIVSEKDCSIERTELSEVLKRYKGVFLQKIPMTSAKKVKGKKLYELARKGIEIERPDKEVNIKELKILDMSEKGAELRIRCSKGTYVRQLAMDIGEDLKVGAYLKDLRRIRSGNFTIEESIAMKNVKNMKKEELYERVLRI